MKKDTGKSISSCLHNCIIHSPLYDRQLPLKSWQGLTCTRGGKQRDMDRSISTYIQSRWRKTLFSNLTLGFVRITGWKAASKHTYSPQWDDQSDIKPEKIHHHLITFGNDRTQSRNVIIRAVRREARFPLVTRVESGLAHAINSKSITR